MSRRVKILVGIVGGLLLVGLVGLLVLVLLFYPVRSSEPEPGSEAGLERPASVYCEQQPARVEMRTAAFDDPNQDIRRTL